MNATPSSQSTATQMTHGQNEVSFLDVCHIIQAERLSKEKLKKKMESIIVNRDEWSAYATRLKKENEKNKELIEKERLKNEELREELASERIKVEEFEKKLEKEKLKSEVLNKELEEYTNGTFRKNRNKTKSTAWNVWRSSRRWEKTT